MNMCICRNNMSFAILRDVKNNKSFTWFSVAYWKFDEPFFPVFRNTYANELDAFKFQKRILISESQCCAWKEMRYERFCFRIFYCDVIWTVVVFRTMLTFMNLMLQQQEHFEQQLHTHKIYGEFVVTCNFTTFFLCVVKFYWIFL